MEAVVVGRLLWRGLLRVVQVRRGTYVAAWGGAVAMSHSKVRVAHRCLRRQ